VDTTLEQPTTTDDDLRAGREAAARYAWGDASARLAAADAASSLDADDLDVLAEATWWLGRTRDCIAARERAYAACLARGHHRRAALMATHLGEHHGVLLEMSVARAWLTRAEKLLDDDRDCIERGHLALILRLFGGDSALAVEAIEIATRHEDRDLLGLALSVQGGILVRGGEVEEGMALLDEATVAAVGGELNPHATGWILCMMISACAGLADWQRAGHWAEATKRWCDRQAISGYPGVCRVHRAEIMRLRARSPMPRKRRAPQRSSSEAST
jgi:hypothetical protein